MDQLLTVDQVAAMLNLKSGWIYDRIAQKNLPFPHVKLGHLVRFPLSGIQRFLEKQTRGGRAK